MALHELSRRRSRAAATTLLVVAVMAVPAVTRSAAGESPAGTRITHVSVEHRDDDSSAIAVAFDGPITGHRWSHIGGENPRAVLRIAGIAEAYRPYEVAVEDGRVVRVRIGHHPEYDPPEEHLVFDLVDDRVAITTVVKQQQRLMVVLERVGASGESRPQIPKQPPPIAQEPTPAPTPPTPTMTSTSTAPPTAIPTVDPTATPTPAPSTPPTSVPPTPPTHPPRVATPDPTPHRPKDVSEPLLTEVVISHREDGSALVRVTADGPIEGSAVSFFRVRVAPPRNILAIPGAGLPGEDAVLSVRDGILCEIRVEFIKEDGPVRTELTFYLASSEVTFENAAVKGAHAVIHLGPPPDPHTPLGCEIESRTRNRSWRFIATGPPKEARLGAN